MLTSADLERLAEDLAPTLDSAAWHDVQRDAYAGDDEAKRWEPTHARALLRHLRTVALDVLTTRQAVALALVCDGNLPPIGPARAADLTELLSMRLVTTALFEATDFGREVHRFRDEHEIEMHTGRPDRQTGRGE